MLGVGTWNTLNMMTITAKAKASKASKCAGVPGYAYDFASLPALVAPLVALAFPLRFQFLEDPAPQQGEAKLLLGSSWLTHPNRIYLPPAIMPSSNIKQMDN